MTRFIKALDVADKISDCIPVISTIKNAGVLIYRLAHRVDSVANPVNTSWKDDIKIHYLSKDLFITSISLLPFVGNFAAFIGHIINSKLSSSKTIGYKRGYLGEAAMHNNYEVAALYLARNPNRPKERLENALTIAAINNRTEIFKLLLDSRNDWSKEFLVKLFRHTKSLELRKYFLDKQALNLKEESEELLKTAGSSFYSSDPLSHIQLVLTFFPEIDKKCLLDILSSSDDEKSITHIFDQLSQEEIEQVISLATQKDKLAVVQKGLEKLYDFKSINNLMMLAAEYSVKVLEWLYNKFGHIVTDEAVLGTILHKCTHVFSGVDKSYSLATRIASSHPNMQKEHIMEAVKRAAIMNAPLFEFYLNHFVNMDLAWIQTKYNDLYNKLNKSKERDNYQEIFDIIQKKYPDLKVT